jgi:hypothetical protein
MQYSLLVRRLTGLFVLAACIGPPCAVASVVLAKTSVAVGPPSPTAAQTPDKTRSQAFEVCLPSYFDEADYIAVSDPSPNTAIAGQGMVAVLANTSVRHAQREPVANNGPNVAIGDLFDTIAGLSAQTFDHLGRREVAAPELV